MTQECVIVGKIAWSHIRSRALACSLHDSLSGDNTSEALPQTDERVDIPLIHLTNTTAILSE